MLFLALGLWGCMPELTKNCVDMTNASSTYLSLGLGAIIGAVISWWIYNMQKKTSMKQDETLRRINQLEESRDKVLKSISTSNNIRKNFLVRCLAWKARLMP